MANPRAERVVQFYLERGNVEAVIGETAATARSWLAEAGEDLPGVNTLFTNGRWRLAYTSAYDTYRHAAEAVILASGYRITSQRGAHEATFALAHAIAGDHSDVFSAPLAGPARDTRNALEYLDPDRPHDVTEHDARWASQLAERAVEAVSDFLA